MQEIGSKSLSALKTIYNTFFINHSRYYFHLSLLLFILHLHLHLISFYTGIFHGMGRNIFSKRLNAYLSVMPAIRSHTHVAGSS